MHGLVTKEDNNDLMLTTTSKDLDKVLARMKVDTAPCPGGLPIIFFKKFWRVVKPYIIESLNSFSLGRVVVTRLNSRVLTLIRGQWTFNSLGQLRLLT
jgi:hypothetical protein